MGGRLLKRWLALPLKDSNKMKPSWGCLHLQENQEVLQKMQNQIKQI
jgi:DNA mismatch repair protein MutS